MSKSIKILFIIVILVAIIVLVWSYAKKPAANQQPAETYVSSSTDSSNAALQSDMTNLDAQLNGLNTDVSNLSATSAQ